MRTLLGRVGQAVRAVCVAGLLGLCTTTLSAETGDPETTRFEVLSLAKLPHHDNVVVRGALSGTFKRPWDLGTGPNQHEGSYKVPVWVVYPLRPGHSSRVALVDAKHPDGSTDWQWHLTDVAEPVRQTLAAALGVPIGGGVVDALGQEMLLDQADFLWSPPLLGSYIYATMVADRSLINFYLSPDFQNGPAQGTVSGIKIDGSYFVSRRFDRAIIGRDVSKLVRSGAALVSALESFAPQDPSQRELRAALLKTCGSARQPCAAKKALSLGFSFTAGTLRDFYFSGLNTRLPQAVSYDDGFVFPGGLVFDGSIQAGVAFNACSDYFRAFDPDGTFRSDRERVFCNGAPAPEQGQVITLNSEWDVQWSVRFADFIDGQIETAFSGFKARPDQGRNGSRNYRVYEIAGTSHVPRLLFDPIAAGFYAYPDLPYQDPVDVRPVYKATLYNASLWVLGLREPPPNALIDMGEQRTVELEPVFGPFDFGPPFDNLFFGGPSRWFVPPARTSPEFDTTQPNEYDFNPEGGIRLPHVRTTLALPGGNHVSVGGPLGVAVPHFCNNFTPLTDPIACPWLVQSGQVPDFPPGWFDGQFVPYKDPVFHRFEDDPVAFNAVTGASLPNPCDVYYPTHAAYSQAVRLAAFYAAEQRWILPEHIPDVIATAERRAEDSGGCVPPEE